MAKSDWIKQVITAIFSILVTYIIMSQTIVRAKADKIYVDTENAKIITAYKDGDAVLKESFNNQIIEIKNLLKAQNEETREQRADIKELLKRVK